MSAASDHLADRLRDALDHRPGITEKRMFGGVCFLLNGNMLACSMKSGAMLLRVGPALHQAALERPYAASMHHAGRDNIGFIEVNAEGLEDDSDLADWLEFADAFVKTLKPK